MLLDVVMGEPVPQLKPGRAQVTLVRVILRVNRLQKKSLIARTIKNSVSDPAPAPDPGGQT